MGFATPSAQPKTRTGKPNRPKRSGEGANGLSAQPRDYPITDSFASKEIPAKRRDAMCRRKSFAQR
jgi:hypothetical protein